MRVCMILEGSYPYVLGGVSSWMHQYIQAMPDTEFVLWCIGASAAKRGKFRYELPANVTEVQEVFLDRAPVLKYRRREPEKIHCSGAQIGELCHLVKGEETDWDVLFAMFQGQRINPAALLASPDFLEMIVDICRQQYPYLPFTEYFHTVRSMLLPELYLLTGRVPEADLYHAASTGYGGLLGSLGKWKYHSGFILTEHGIYTREREEELLRAEWVLPRFRQQWMQLFYNFSDCAYQHADRVTALFARANETQIELGCPREKVRVIENGVHADAYCRIPPKQENGWIDIGAIVRIARIKDIRTMIYAFADVKAAVPNARLHILGGVDDREYYEECLELADHLQVEDLLFCGVVDVRAYLEQLDFTVLSSISEGQPLAVLESLAAARPVVATDVGCCRELLEGAREEEAAGICVPPMQREQLAQAMIRLCRDASGRRKMGQAGRARVAHHYTHAQSMEKYQSLYREVMELGGDRI